MKSKSILSGPVVIMLLLVLVGWPASDSWGMGSRVPAIGMEVEDFQLTDLEGKPQSLSQYRGKIVLLNFWATWCKPCTTEMPAMQASYDKLRDSGSWYLRSTNWKTMRGCGSTSRTTAIHSPS